MYAITVPIGKYRQTSGRLFAYPGLALDHVYIGQAVVTFFMWGKADLDQLRSTLEPGLGNANELAISFGRQ